jgi:hypothetical protein
LESNLIAFSAAINDWPWFGQLTLHDQFLCDVSLVNSYTAIVSSRCLIRWNQGSSNLSQESPDASTLAVRFGLIRGGNRQPPARLQAKVQQVRQDQIVSWLHLSALDCDQVVVDESRCVRPPLNFVCLPSSAASSAAGNQSQKEVISTSLNFEFSACFVVYTDLSEERTLFMAATALPVHRCKHQSFGRHNLTLKAQKPLTTDQLSGNSLCVKSVIQHETVAQSDGRKHDESVAQLQQRLAQQPGSPLYCQSGTSGWTLVGLMKRPLAHLQQSSHSSELYFEFDRTANHDMTHA